MSSGVCRRQQHAWIQHLPCMAEQGHIGVRTGSAVVVIWPPFCNGRSHMAREGRDSPVAIG
jgi:hypothetical protein